jgi:hypothetical protein
MQIGQSTKLNLLSPLVVAFPPLTTKLPKRCAAKSSLAFLKAKNDQSLSKNAEAFLIINLSSVQLNKRNI